MLHFNFPRIAAFVFSIAIAAGPSARSQQLVANGVSLSTSNQTFGTAAAGESASALFSLNGGSISASNVTLSTTGASAHGAFATSTGQITINTATVSTSGGGSYGLASFGAGSLVSARNATITTSGLGSFGIWTDNSATLTLDGGRITTFGTNASGVRVGLVPGGIGGGTLTVSNTIVETHGSGGNGIRVTDNDSRAIASNMTITTRNSNAPGLSSVGRNSLVISNSRVTTLGNSSEGILVQDRGFVSATNTQITSNTNAVLIGSGGTISNPNTVIIDGGSLTSLSGDAIAVLNNTRSRIVVQNNASLSAASGNLLNVQNSPNTRFEASNVTLAGNLNSDFASAANVTLNSGATLVGTMRDTRTTLNPNSRWNVTQPSRLQSLTWNGGTIQLAVDQPQMPPPITVTGALTRGGSGPYQFDLNTPADLQLAVPYSLIGSNSTNFTPDQFSLQLLNPLLTAQARFLVTGSSSNPGEVQIIIDSIQATGPLLQNDPPVGIPPVADFTVAGKVVAGTPTQPATINSLTFEDNSSLQAVNDLTVTSGNLDVPEGTATISGKPIVLPGDFSKEGEGTLVANSDILINNAAVINGGTLAQNGTLSAADGLTIAENTMLAGRGVIDADVSNQGTVNPGTPGGSGSLTINGNYTQGPAGQLTIEVESPKEFDQLNVNGTASLAGTLAVVPINTTLAFGQKLPGFLTAESVQGAFDSILLPTGFRGRVIDDQGTLTLLIAPASYTQVAQSPNQLRAAQALDKWIGIEAGDIGEVTLALDELTGSQYPAAFEAIGPAWYSSLLTISIEQSQARGQLINQQLGATRLAGRPAMRLQGVEPSPISYDKNGKSILEPSIADTPSIPDTRWSLWALGTGLFAKSGALDSIPNYRFNTGGFLVGGDYSWSESFMTGVFGGYEGTDANYANSGRTQSNAFRFGTYASYSTGGFYSNAIIGAAFTGYNVDRPIEWTGFERDARSKPTGGEFFSLLALGYDWTLGNFTFGPSVSAQYTYLRIGPVTESGADSLNLRVPSFDTNSFRSYLGGHIAYTWTITNTIRVIPEVRLFWHHEFLQDTTDIDATLDGGAGPEFFYRTSAPPRDAVFCGAGLIVQLGNRFSANVYYNADFGRSNLIYHLVSTGFELKF